MAILFAISAMTSPAAGQNIPAVGTIDYYGLQQVQKGAVKRALQITRGDNPAKSRQGAEARLEAIPGISRARLNFVCCDTLGKTVLYVGIEEKGAAKLRFRPAPKGQARL
jgi:hypothetical protein